MFSGASGRLKMKINTLKTSFVIALLCASCLAPARENPQQSDKMYAAIKALGLLGATAGAAVMPILAIRSLLTLQEFMSTQFPKTTLGLVSAFQIGLACNSLCAIHRLNSHTEKTKKTLHHSIPAQNESEPLKRSPQYVLGFATLAALFGGRGVYNISKLKNLLQQDKSLTIKKTRKTKK